VVESTLEGAPPVAGAGASGLLGAALEAGGISASPPRLSKGIGAFLRRCLVAGRGDGTLAASTAFWHWWFLARLARPCFEG